MFENGRYARPTSDRNFAGAIAEQWYFLIVLGQLEFGCAQGGWVISTLRWHWF